MLAYVSRYFNVIAPLLRRAIRKRYGYELAAKAYDGARPIYRQMLADFPSIGADNPMADNAYEALVFFAMYRAAEGELTPDMLRAAVGDLFELPVVRGAVGLSVNLNRAADMRRMNEALRSHVRWADNHPAEAPLTWDFNFGDTEGDTRVCYHFTRCPLNDFCRERGLLDVLPIMCEVDHITARLAHGRLTREHTLAQGGAVCDYLIEGDERAHGGEAATRKDSIRGAYKVLGGSATVYDAMMTCGTPLGVAMSWAVWLIGPQENAAYLEAAMAGVPEGFSGSLLEVPVGTGVLTMPLYRSLPDAQVTCLDYSSDMMAAAQARAVRDGLSNVSFVRGDVGALPFDDESFDIVMSLNGFHAFPDKEAAYAETFRVLKPGGVFCGCFYVKGEVALTDGWVRHFHEPRGFFTPPYETAASLEERLRGMYAQVHVETHKAIACFVCVK